MKATMFYSRSSCCFIVGTVKNILVQHNTAHNDIVVLHEISKR